MLLFQRRYIEILERKHLRREKQRENGLEKGWKQRAKDRQRRFLAVEMGKGWQRTYKVHRQNTVGCGQATVVREEATVVCEFRRFLLVALRVR